MSYDFLCVDKGAGGAYRLIKVKLHTGEELLIREAKDGKGL